MNDKQAEYGISDPLLKLLEEEHPDRLPDYEPCAFDLGVAVGEQKIIKKIKMLTHPEDYEIKQNEEG